MNIIQGHGDIAIQYEGRYVGDVETSDDFGVPMYFAHSWLDEEYEAVHPTFDDAAADVIAQAQHYEGQRRCGNA